MPGRLGRSLPVDRHHVAKYALALAPSPLPVPAKVEDVLPLPSWHWSHDQGATGTCVGHGTVLERAIAHLEATGRSIRFDPIWAYVEARRIAGNPYPEDLEDGWTVRGGYDVARTEGERPVWSMRLVDEIPTPERERAVDVSARTKVTRWATTVDECRAAIAAKAPVTLGINWYTRFDDPTKLGIDYWAARDGDELGSIRGGHCLVAYGASDRRQAVKLKNSWGRSYPLVWLPYSVLGRLLSEAGEAAVSTDR